MCNALRNRQTQEEGKEQIISQQVRKKWMEKKSQRGEPGVQEGHFDLIAPVQQIQSCSFSDYLLFHEAIVPNSGPRRKRLDFM